jgi:hypothetical protein
MTLAVAPRIRRLEPVAIVIAVTVAVTGARPAITFCFSFVLFWCNILSGLGAFLCLTYWARRLYSLAPQGTP